MLTFALSLWMLIYKVFLWPTHVCTNLSFCLSIFFMMLWTYFFILFSILSVLSCALLLVLSGLNCLILVTQSPKYTRLKRITNQFSFVYIVAKSLYIYCCHVKLCSVANHIIPSSKFITTLKWTHLTACQCSAVYLLG